MAAFCAVAYVDFEWFWEWCCELLIRNGQRMAGRYRSELVLGSGTEKEIKAQLKNETW